MTIKNLPSNRILLSTGFLLLLAVAVLARRGHGAADHHQGGAQEAPRHVDLVIALDTSSSMDGLIDGARQKLWDVVSLLSQARPQPVLRVGLISYGNDSYDARVGWVRKDSDLTGDLDGLYGKLFALRTGGGTEYVARAVQKALTDMQWTTDDRALKIVFVAGNEPADQDPQVPVQQIVAQARELGVFVNTIYCGSESAGEAALWRQVASVGGGKFAAIDQNSNLAVATPMDAELQQLSARLNGTYVAYGAGGRARALNQVAQDRNAQALNAPAAAARAVAKASKLYAADDWDLVDAKAKNKKDLSTMKDEELPTEMRGMTSAQRQAYLDGKTKEREAIQKQITEVASKRAVFLRAERKKPAAHGKALDDALDDSIRTEAQSAGFKF